MTTKEELIELLIEHGFERGKSVNTKDWYAKRTHEIILTENGYIHIKNQGSKLIPEYQPNASLRQLELIIFDYRLNKTDSKRNHVGIVILKVPSISTVIPKRRAKMVEGFEMGTV